MAETTIDPSIKPITIGPAGKPTLPLGLGGSLYGTASAVDDAAFMAAMAAAYDGGIRHFDTATGYAGGHSEELYGRFLKGRRDDIFLASKSDPSETTGEAMTAAIDGSLKRLGTDHIDLYYIHWPKSGRDMRPRMEALEAARKAGKIGAIGVSNFSVADMESVSEAGRIDAHQLGYNMLWRHAEADVIPWCRANGVAVIAYSALAHGILTGKYGAVPDIGDGDQRHTILPFRADIWPHVHAGVERLKAIAAETGRPLAHLAMRWTLAQPGIDAVLFGARDAAQARANVAALAGAVPASVLERMTAESDEISAHVPDEGNLFNHRP